MRDKEDNNFITFIGASLLALFFFILSLIDKKLIINPYTFSLGIAIILGMFIYFAIKSSKDTRSELVNQKVLLESFKKEFNFFLKESKEKFKIHDRLNKLEVKVYE